MLRFLLLLLPQNAFERVLFTFFVVALPLAFGYGYEHGFGTVVWWWPFD